MSENEHRDPPHDLGAEQAVLGCILLKPEVLPLVRLILPDPKMFFNRGYGMIYWCMCRVAHRNDPLDHVTVGSEMNRLGYLEKVGGALIFDQLQTLAVPSAVVEHYAKIVARLYTYRQIMDAGKEIRLLAAKAPENPTEFFAQTKSILSASCRIGDNEMKAVTAEEGARLVWNHLDQGDGEVAKKTYIPTGILGIDLPRGILTTVGGRTSNGKTAFALNIELNAARMGFKCLHLSLEDNAVRFYIRMMANLAQIVNTKISEGNLTSDERSRLLETAEKMRELPISVFAKKGVNAEFIRQYAATQKEMNGLDMLVVDYIQLIRGRPGQQRIDKVSEAVQELVVLAEELDICVVAVSQVARPFGDRSKVKVPMIHDLKESGDIENASKVVLLVHRPYTYDKTEDPCAFRLNIAKASEGRTGEYDLYGDMPHMWIGEVREAMAGVAPPHYTDGY